MRNSELQERSEAADGYKEIARAYIMQALDLFLEKKQEFEVESWYCVRVTSLLCLMNAITPQC